MSVAADVATVRDLVLEICVEGRCREHRVALYPGASTTDETCTGTGPDDTCSDCDADGTQAHITLDDEGLS